MWFRIRIFWLVLIVCTGGVGRFCDTLVFASQDTPSSVSVSTLPMSEYREWRDPVTGMPFVWVPGGSFQMGRDGYKGSHPMHTVSLDGFWMGKYEVTQEQWERVMGNNPSRFQGERLPVERVSWGDCHGFIRKLETMSNGGRYFLPTEAQWEYAARGGSVSRGTRFAGSNTVEAVAWHNPGNKQYTKTHEIGGKKANELGLYDMSGNVWEWCRDWYDPEYYASSPVKNPSGPASGKDYVMRGGAYLFKAPFCYTIVRAMAAPEDAACFLGFRLVRSGGKDIRGSYCPSAGQLYVDVWPNDAHVQILNHEQAYARGEEIEQGRYDLLVSADGFFPQRRTVRIRGGERLRLNFELQPEDRREWRDPHTGITFAWIRGGSFQMGSPPEEKWRDSDEGPVHNASVDGFWMSTSEITQDEWEKVMGSNPSQFKSGSHPVENVSWYDCQDFIDKLHMQSADVRYALPTETQWEYTARGGRNGRGYIFAGSDNPDNVARYRENSQRDPMFLEDPFLSRPLEPGHAGVKMANEAGVSTMSGNVWEWCSDWYSSSYTGADTKKNPIGPPSGSKRVRRGGSYVTTVGECRSASRSARKPDYVSDCTGLRLVCLSRNSTSDVSKTDSGRLFVDTSPSDGEIRIMNIKPAYKRGMYLPPNMYDVQVSAPGYETRTRKVKVRGGEYVFAYFELFTPQEIVIAQEGQREWRDPATGMRFMHVPGGCYTMGGLGASDEKPRHKVCLDEFWIGKYEVTREEWAEIMGGNSTDDKTSRLPVTNVNLEDCQLFAEKLADQGRGDRYALPTEAQWEYAARGGSRNRYWNKYSGSSLLTEVGWCRHNKGGLNTPHPVGGRAANSLGLHDMSGNVQEWCRDWYGKTYYSFSPEKNPGGPATGKGHVIRGGAWFDRREDCRSAARSRGYQGKDGRQDGIGFRLIRIPAGDDERGRSKAVSGDRVM